MFSLFQVIAILDKLKDEKKGTSDEDDERGEFSEGRDDGVEWEGDDVDDEGIIYVK